ncbi:hypothetical protein BDF20DRAFT_563166 [Mycotypha africana]|uniref:uncharacterized protein n=1 Tax=Mycotypha africana TaxID=64632 RepID=UPI0023000030|nr:uncharacterized protein BDF20DRAFT_563166 [Mycotypha africana]KAI8977376.1 hypothetical protein BDF20DRAFT_563166 [Mycotypha africana]
MQDALLWQNVIQIIMSCLLMLCLIGDITVLTTRKLSVANWYWRPGLIFCGLTAVNETIILSDALVNSVTIFGNCHQRLISTERTFELIDEICYMQMSLSFIFTMGSMIKAISLSIVYAVTAYFQNRNTIHELKREASTSDMPLENMTSYYSQY